MAAERVTYVGHATVLAELGGTRLLTDPVLRSRVGPLRRHGAAPAPGVASDIDAVLLSHLHHDHADLPSLRGVGRDVPVLVPRGAGELLERRGFSAVSELAPGASREVGAVTVTAVEATHSGERRGAKGAGAVGYLLEGPRRVYFAGDTDLFQGMERLGGDLDLALLPVWGWGPSLGPGHLDPERAARAAALLSPRVAVPIHWGTLYPFGLARLRPGPLRSPPREFAAWMRDLAPQVEARVLEPGEATSLCFPVVSRLPAVTKWGVLAVLAAAQFLMVLDQAVMNVAISQLVADFDTTVTTIQAVIAFYALVMAGLMLTGGKMGDLWGRRRAFAIGLCIYGAGSALTAASWSVPSLALGWSVLEGIGAALVLPAMVALVAANFEGGDRALAYGVLGGVAGAGIAVGPILGGWVTTELSWRLVFAGEVVVAIGILLGTRLIREAPRSAVRSRLDWVGGALSALGLGLVVMGVLQASNWGWLHPRSSPLEPFGFSLTPFVIAAGGVLLAAFVAWERRHEERGGDPLLHMRLLRIPSMRGGLTMMLAQNLILMGVFFTVPLFLQVVQGLDALETGVRMLPASAGLFVSALAGSALAKRYPARTLVRAGLLVVLVATLLLLDTIEPQLDNASFLIAMGVLGVGMGLIVSQLGNVVQSTVSERDRSEAGGLQYTAQQLGSSLGTAFLGAVVLTGLIAAFSANVAANPRVGGEVHEQVETRLSAGVSFVPSSQVEAAAAKAGVDPATVHELVDGYEDAQLEALKIAFLFAALLVLASLFATRHLPARRFDELRAQDDP